MRGERQPRTGRSEQQGSAASELLPDPQPAKEQRRQKPAPDEHPEALPPLSLDTRRAGGEEAPREAAQGASRDSPLLSRPSEGREEEEEGSAGCSTSEEVPARGKVFGAGGREEPEGRDDLLRSAYERFLAKASHCAEDQSTHKSQVRSLVQTLPLHLV